jgi:YD repeat-containing protein
MKASAADVENTWNLTPANDPALNLHPSITVGDVGANSQKYWRFTTTAGPYLGLSDRYEERTGAGTAIHRKDYTWTQGPSLNPYVTAVTTTLDPGTAYEIQTKSTQVLDAYGNISNLKIYPYGNLSTPARTYEYTYLHVSNTNYAPRYIRNRVSEVYLTDGANPRTRILWKRYDVSVGNAYYLPQEGPATLTQQNGTPLHDDANFGTSFQYRGNVAYVLDLASDSHLVYATTGVVTSATNGAGVQVSASTSSNTGFSLSETLTPGGNSSLSTFVGYNSGWAVTSVTGANGANSTTTYDTYGRPTSSKIPDGAVTNYT